MLDEQFLKPLEGLPISMDVARDQISFHTGQAYHRAGKEKSRREVLRDAGVSDTMQACEEHRMASEIHSFKADDGLQTYYRVWKPEADDKLVGIIHILHGMAEHSGRYEEFATFLTSCGYIVYAQDHRGHGMTAERNHMPYGFFAEQDGWKRIMDDCSMLDQIIMDEQSDELPFFLLGHSMGSFLARSVMVGHADLFSGVIAMGTGCSQGMAGKFGLWLAKRHVRKLGARTPDAMLEKLSFAFYLKHIPDPRTGSDWLSRDEKMVDRYEHDPQCGFTCTTSFFRDLLTGLAYANDPANAEKLPDDLPILLISGSEDPVGGWSKGVRKVYDLYHEAGIGDLTLHLVEGARHELLNETDREETYRFLLDWMEDRQ